MKKLFLATVAVAAMATSAFAADLPRNRQTHVAVPVAAPAGFDWTGLYVGAQLGYSWSNTAMTTGPNWVSFNGNGVIGGIHIGYNWQHPSNFVFGLEADANYGDTKGRFDLGQSLSLNSKLDTSGSVRARLGYAAGNFMPYLTGGVAIGNINHSLLNGSTPILSYTAAHIGWTVGGGVEYAFDRNWSARIEYRYTDFGSKNYGTGVLPHSFKLNMHDVKAGISYRF